MSIIPLQTAFDTFSTLDRVSPHASRSARYQLVQTGDVLRGLDAEGYRIHGITQMRVRNSDREGFQKHVVRLRHVDQRAYDDGAPEIVLINSHDGASAYSLFAGWLRFVCSNGLIAGTAFESQSVRHTGDVAHKVIEATHKIASRFQLWGDSVDAMKARQLTVDETERFAVDAHALRYGTSERTPVSPLALLNYRRADDADDSLWSVYNRVQENITRGGLRGVTLGANGRMRRASTRGIRGIDTDVRINRGLHDRAIALLAA